MGLLSPFDLPNVQAVIAVLDKNTKTRSVEDERNLVDRREGGTLRVTLNNAHKMLGQLNAETQASNDEVALAQEKVDALNKLLKLAEKRGAGMPQPLSPTATIMRDNAEIKKKLANAEWELGRVEKLNAQGH